MIHHARCPAWLCLSALAALLCLQPALAVDRIKENNTNNLNLTTSWVGGNVPTSSDVGVWDDTVTGTNTTALGGNLSWEGIRIGGITQNGAVTINAGSILTLGNAGIAMSSAPRNLNLNSGITVGANQTWTVGANRTLNLKSSTGNLLSGSANVTKNGAGTLRTDGGTSILPANNFSGTLTIEQGTWTITGLVFTDTSGVTIVLKEGARVENAGGAVSTITSAANIGSVTHLDGNVTLVGTTGGTSNDTRLVIGRATGGTAAVNLRANLGIDVPNAPNPLGGGYVVISGVSEDSPGRTLTKTGPGDLWIEGRNITNNWTGNLLINEGTVRIQSYGKLPTNGNATINGGTLFMNTYNSLTLNTLTLTNGSVQQGILAPAATLSATSFVMSNGSVSQILAGAGGTMTKGTSGTVTLSAANTYGGGTTISAGTLLVNNTTGSGAGTGTVNVGSSGILGGNGTITGNTTIGGSLRPGNSIGTLTVDDDVTWNAGTNWVFELGTAGVNMGSPGTSDLLNLTGAGSDFIKGSGSGWTFDFDGGGQAGWYQLVNWTGTSGFTGSDFAGTNLAPGLSVGSFVVDGPSTALYLEVIPEPGTLGMISLAIAAFGILRRKRKSACPESSRKTIPFLSRKGASPAFRRLVGIISAVWLVFASVQGIASPDASAPQPASLFTDHMVLQRDTPVKIWGVAQPADSIVVEFGGQSQTTTADADGHWAAVLQPLPASTESRELTVRSAKTGQKTVLKDVLVGDVWLCSGQSNMQWSVAQSSDGPAVLQTCDQPLIRGFVVNSDSSAEPRDKVAGRWQVCAPAKGDQPSPVASWSGVAFFFGARLHAETEIPVGLVMASVGGTAIESWMSPEALEKSGLGGEVKSRWQSWLDNLPGQQAEFHEAQAAWEKELASAKSEGRQPQGKRPRAPAGPGSQMQPSSLWNAMILPLVPFQWAGILWYQAEANASRYLEYPALQASLIEQWRRAFEQPDLPFYFFQLPGYARSPGAGAGPGLAFIREAQQTSLTLPHTGMAVTVDLAAGDDLHPPNKRDFGERMADIVLVDFGKKQGPVGGPEFSKATPGKNNMLVEFQGKPELALKNPDAPRAFLLSGEDRVFHPATAQLDGRTLVVASPAVPQPVAVRYAWFAAPQALLFGKNGWPAAPFRSDDWKTGEFKYQAP